MAETILISEPRPSLLLAVMFTGWATALADGKGWIDDWGSGQMLANVALGWMLARWWYFTRDHRNGDNDEREG